MASGKRHAVDTSTSIVVVVCIVSSITMAMMFPNVGIYVVTQWRVVLAFVAGLCVGHYATPDVRDQHRQINEGERLVKEHFGKRAFRLWVAIWWPMAYIIPHRSPWSHLPIVATCLAAAWLYWLPMVALWYYAPGWFDVAMALMPHHVAGWALQDAVHLWQDGGLRKGIRW